MADRLAFYIRCPREGEPPSTSLCTGLQIILSEGITYREAFDIICEQVNAEFRRYMAHEILRGLGVQEKQDG